MRLYTGLIRCLIVVVLLLALARVMVSNRISTSGVALGRLNEEIQSLRVENDLLSEKLLSLSSLNNLASEAAKLGFNEKKDNFVLSNPLPIAQR